MAKKAAKKSTKTAKTVEAKKPEPAAKTEPSKTAEPIPVGANVACARAFPPQSKAK